MRHKLLAGIIPFCSGKRKPSTFTSSSLTDCNHITTNNNMLHSKSTYFYRWSSRYISIAPIACALTLLVGVGFLLNPTTKAQEVYAAEDEEKCKTTADEYGVCAMELGIFMNSTDSAFNELPATELSTDSVVHRDYSFSIRAVDTKDGYDLYAGVVNTGSFGNSLVNADYPTEEHMIKALSGENIAYSSIGNNEWGYALTSTNQNAEELSYNALPVATITTEGDNTTLTNGKLLVHGEDTGYDPSQPVGEDKHTDQDYKLYFAAKASPESPSGHYRTQVMLSLIANPKNITSSMQDFAKRGLCESLEGPKRLKDSRDDKLYWVSKVTDNGVSQCIMTQNLDLDIPADGLKAIDTDIERDWGSSLSVEDQTYFGRPAVATVNGTDWSFTSSDVDVVQSYDPGEYIINQATTSWSGKCSSSKDPKTCERYTAITADTSKEDLHYAVGNYYSYDAATAGTGGKTDPDKQAPGSICPKGWKLFDNDDTKSFKTVLINQTQITIREAPFYFPAAGYVLFGLTNIGTEGNYRSSRRVRAEFINRAYILNFGSNSIRPQDGNSSIECGMSVRCIIK